MQTQACLIFSQLFIKYTHSSCDIKQTLSNKHFCFFGPDFSQNIFYAGKGRSLPVSHARLYTTLQTLNSRHISAASLYKNLALGCSNQRDSFRVKLVAFITLFLRKRLI